MASSGDRTSGACAQTGAGPASQRRSLVRRGRRSGWLCLQGRSRPVNRGHPVRRGSEQRTPGHPSLVGSRGGGDERDYPCPNAVQSRPVRLFILSSGRQTVTHGCALCLPAGKSGKRKNAAPDHTVVRDSLPLRCHSSCVTARQTPDMTRQSRK